MINSSLTDQVEIFADVEREGHKQLIEKASSNMSEIQWKAFSVFLNENGIELNESCLEYGSLFLSMKLAFISGWKHSE